MRAALRFRSPDIDVFVRTQLTYAALDNMSVELSAIPNRKNLIWITDGVPVGLGYRRSDTGEAIDFTPQIRRLSESLDRAGIAIYPVREIMMGRDDGIGEASGIAQTGGAGTGVSSIETLNQFRRFYRRPPHG